MKNCLSILLNSIFKQDLEFLYGKGSFVDITEVKKCTTNKKYLITCKLNVGDPSLFSDIGEDGLSHLLSESWQYTGYGNETFILVTSYDVTP